MNGPHERGLSATEALLAQAAATLPGEEHAARLALIATVSESMRPMDRTLLVAGDGTAGRTLLGGSRPGPWADHPGPTCAVRSCRLLAAHAPPTEAQVADDARGRAVFADYVTAPGGGP